jgi:predicted PolB exonuclease-like 3'-5' exonuclease
MRLYSLSDLSASDIARVMHTKNREAGNGDSLPVYLCSVMTMSCIRRTGSELSMCAAANHIATETGLLEDLQKTIDEGIERVVAWDGHRKDFPLLNYRFLSRGMTNALSGKVDLVDLSTEISQGNSGDLPSLHETAMMCGLPGNQGLSEYDIWRACLDNNDEIVQYNCELNAINSWLVYLANEFCRGNISRQQQDMEYQLLQDYLVDTKKPHLVDFVQAWVSQ